MPLTANKERVYGVGDKLGYPVAAATKIYKNAAVGEDEAGYARPLQAGDKFLGFAQDRADNSDGAAGELSTWVKSKGYVELPITDLAITANDRPLVYASDDDTFTLTGTNNSLVGSVAQFLSAGFAVIEFNASLQG